MSFGIGSINATANAAITSLESLQSRILQNEDALSSGSALGSAADNPSGLAIFNRLESQVSSLNAASQNVQTASDALSTADGALANTEQGLQSLSSLAVQATNGLLSPSDQADLQTVANQLVQQINSNAQNVNFNGVALLNGQFAGTTPATPASATTTANTALAGGGTLVQSVTPSAASQSGTIALTVVNSGNGTAGVQVAFTNSATGTTTVQPALAAAGSTVNVNGTQVVLGNFSTADTSTSSTVQVQAATAATQANTLQVNSGGAEGTISNFNLPNAGSSALLLQNVDLSSPAAATNAQGQINAALTQLNAARATLGAQSVAAGEQLQNNAVAANALTASASNIGDANVPSLATELSLLRTQQLVSLDTLRQANDQFGVLNSFFNVAV
jgi:flagellin